MSNQNIISNKFDLNLSTTLSSYYLLTGWSSVGGVSLQPWKTQRQNFPSVQNFNHQEKAAVILVTFFTENLQRPIFIFSQMYFLWVCYVRKEDGIQLLACLAQTSQTVVSSLITSWPAKLARKMIIFQTLKHLFFICTFAST